MVDPYESPRVDPAADEEVPDLEYASATSTGERLTPTVLGLFGIAWLYVAYQGRGGLMAVPTYPGAVLQWLGSFVAALVGAAGVAAILLAIGRRYQGWQTFPTQLGHWLLILVGADWLQRQFADYLFMQLIRTKLAEFSDNSYRTELAENPDAHYAVILGISYFVLIALVIAAIYYCRRDRLWQRYLIMRLVLGSWLGISFLATGYERQPTFVIVSAAINGLLILSYGIALLRDCLKPQGRDTLHWVGVSLPIFSAFTVLAERFSPPPF